ncbi:MAG TPA: DNA-binding protein Alba [archaeon]|nr:DNA-binding protein Alba [archaeon]
MGLSGQDNTVYIGSKKGTMAYVMAVVMQMNIKGNTEVTLKARGKAISRAVDVAEIVRNKFLKDVRADSIRIYTEDIKGENDAELKVSAIEISLKK